MINRAEFLTNILRYATMTDNHENIIDNVLEYLGSALDADRSYIFEEFNGTHFDNTYEWCKEGVNPEKANLQGLPYEIGDIWYKEYDKNKNIMIYDIDKYKDVAPAMYEVLEPQGIKTLVTGPLELNGKYIGFYGVDNPPVNIMEDISIILTTLSYVISIMIANRDALNKIKKMSLEDQLTGVFNRHALTLVEEDFEYDDDEICLMMCDVNGLKKVNDTQGHTAGDKLIINSANSLAKVFHKDNVYRVGGDEFVVILKNTDEDIIKEKIEKLRSFLELWDITMAIGYIHYDSNKYSIQQMMKEADIKMYEDKVRFYSRAGNDRRANRRN